MAVHSRSLLLLAGLGALLLPVAFAQHANHTSAAATPVVALVDGTQHPELIPDQDALKMFLIALVAAPDATESDRARMYAKMKPMDLTQADEALFLSAVRGFGPVWKSQQSQAQQLFSRFQNSPGDAQTATTQMVSIQQQIDSLVGATFANLLNQLSPDGQAKLRRHLAHVKTKMKLIPAPDMSSKR